MEAKVRLYVDQPLGAGQAVAVGPEQAHYLFAVMRLAAGDAVLLFNGRDGEWVARIEDAGKRRGLLQCESPTRPQWMPPDLWLLFAPVRKERTAFLVEKAVELGVRRLCPVTTRFSSSERWRHDKEVAHAIEAAEQCGALFVPEVENLQPLDRVLANWPSDRRLLWADETRGAGSSSLAGVIPKDAPCAILVGPEGGFSDSEKDRLRGLEFVRPITLGPRILRAETAAIAALVLWQSALGDWT